MAENNRVGRYINRGSRQEAVRAYIPVSLPPDPPLEYKDEDIALLGAANQALGRLDGLSGLLPDTQLFLYMYIRKEAVLSSQIEGTQSSLSDLLLFEENQTPGVPIDDVTEVSNYVSAIYYGLERIRSGFPLSNRLLREIHGILLSKGRGAQKQPGEFRTSQNWVGGTRPGNADYVPPPPEYLQDQMASLEKFLHVDPKSIPTLIKAALVHVQFETIHPFLDGNGRLGRLLISLLLCVEKALKDPVLYLSLYLKRNRETYYDHLQKVRINGSWEDWVRFFLVGVRETAEQAVDTAQRILGLFEQDKNKIKKLGRSSGSAFRIHELLQKKGFTSIPRAAKQLGLSQPAVKGALENLQTLNIVKESTGKKRYRSFVYRSYLQILMEGNEPL